MSSSENEENIADEDRESITSTNEKNYVVENEENIADEEKENISDEEREDIAVEERENIADEERENIADEERENIADEERENIADQEKENNADVEREHITEVNEKSNIEENVENIADEHREIVSEETEEDNADENDENDAEENEDDISDKSPDAVNSPVRKHEISVSPYPNVHPNVDLDTYFEQEVEINNKLGIDLNNDEDIQDGEEFDGFKKPDHSEVIHDIFGDSEEEEDFEGFNENEVEKEAQEPIKEVLETRTERIVERVTPSHFEDEELLLERSNDILRSFEDIVARQKIEKRINRPRRRDNVEYLNDMDDRIADLMNKMRLAAVEDEELYHLGQPGIKKMQLLPVVRDLLRQSNIKEVLIESKFLVVMAAWLKPLPNHILPPLDIRVLMLKSLLEFPTLSSDILKECNIGKAVMYLYKHPKETIDNKKIAGHLINEWSRPIFNLSSNYNGMTREDRLERDRAIVSKRKLVDNDASAKREIHDDDKSGNEPWIPRATVPKPSNKDYIIRPNWRAGENRRSTADEDDDDDDDNDDEEDGRHRGNLRLSSSTDKKRSRISENANKDLHLERTFRKIKDAGKKRKMIQRAANISIQGRGLDL